MENTQQTTNLAGLFLQHAGGMVTERALRDRQKRILNFMSAHKFTMSRETFESLTQELAAIGIELGKV